MIVVLIICCLPLTACSESNKGIPTDFVADESHCVVSLPQEYDILYEDNEHADLTMFDKNLYNADTVHGKSKIEGYRYYNVLKNKPFRIVTPLGIMQNRNADRQTLVYWKLNDALFKDGDYYYSANAFTCTKDTEIVPVYCEFRAVGMLLHATNKTVADEQDDNFFDDNGNIADQDGVYYLFGVYDFEPDQQFWRTNLTIDKYEIHHTTRYVSGNYSQDFYTINIEIAQSNLFDKGELVVHTLYKIDGHGYMTYGAKQIINADATTQMIRTLPIGIHEIKYTFS